MKDLIQDRFTILSDPEGTSIISLGLGDFDETDRGVISRPAVFVVDARGIIRYRYVGRSASDRPTTALLILAAESVASESVR